LPKINLSKIGSASAAAATGAILAIAPVFAQTTPSQPTGNGSVITIIINAANAASVTYTFSISAETAAELAAKLAAHQAELAAEAAQTNEVDEDEDEDEDDAAEAAHVQTNIVTKTVTVTVNGQTKTFTVQHESENDKD
jgi:hypothetical protein